MELHIYAEARVMRHRFGQAEICQTTLQNLFFGADSRF